MKQSLVVIISLVCSIVISGCMGAIYYDVAEEEIDAPELIPQEGTTLSLEISYEPDLSTRFQPGEESRRYRYHVLIDGWEYSYGISFGNYQTSSRVSIPIMANDTHFPVSVIVEGAKALDYKSIPSVWDDWHIIYRGTQEALEGTEESKYTGLEGLYLGVRIGDKTYKFEFQDSGASEVFKRLLMGREITLPISTNYFISFPYSHNPSDEVKDFLTLLESSVPEDHREWNESLIVGGFYLSAYGMMIIVLQEGHKLNGYNSLLATVCKEDLKALKKLSSPWHAPEHFELTLSLVAGK